MDSLCAQGHKEKQTGQKQGKVGDPSVGDRHSRGLNGNTVELK